jgi:hypothetical protein
MPDLVRQAQSQRVEPTPGDLDNFFAWAQDTKRAKGPVKETLRLIEVNCRDKFEFVFKRKHEDVKERKKFLAEGIRQWRKILEEVEALEGAFAQTHHISEHYELALAKKDNGPAAVNGRNTLLFANIKLIVESQLEDDEENLRTLKKHKKPISNETLLLRVVADFLFQNEFSPAQTLEITKLMLFHETKSWPDDEKLAKEHRKLMDKYGISRKRKPRTRG